MTQTPIGAVLAKFDRLFSDRYQMYVDVGGNLSEKEIVKIYLANLHLTTFEQTVTHLFEKIDDPSVFPATLRSTSHRQYLGRYSPFPRVLQASLRCTCNCSSRPS
jgi:hypothetical protein